mgnify:FL=1
MSKSKKKNLLDYFEHVFLLFGTIVIIVMSLVVAVNFTRDSRIFAKEKAVVEQKAAVEPKKEVQSPVPEETKAPVSTDEPKEKKSASSGSEKKTTAIKVEIINSTGKSGEGTRLGNTLKSSGLNVVSVKSGKFTSATKVIERNNKGYGDDVIKLIKIGKLSKELIKNSSVDVTIILGGDYLP